MIKEYTYNLPVIFVGDLHGEFAGFAHHILDKGITDHLFFQVGDFGIGFYHRLKEASKLRKLSGALKEGNNKLVAIRGNHDDPSYFDGRIYDEVQLLADYSIVKTPIGNILGIGGAISVDRISRVSGRSWWSGETFRLDTSRASAVRDVNIIVTHSSPTGVFPIHSGELLKGWARNDPTLLQETSLERDQIKIVGDIVRENNNIVQWVYGHFHTSSSEIISNINYRCLAIRELWSPNI